jgi:hypothetical protein
MEVMVTMSDETCLHRHLSGRRQKEGVRQS